MLVLVVYGLYGIMCGTAIVVAYASLESQVYFYSLKFIRREAALNHQGAAGWVKLGQAMVQGLWFAINGARGAQVWKHHRATSCICNMIGWGSWLIVAI